MNLYTENRKVEWVVYGNKTEVLWIPWGKILKGREISSSSTEILLPDKEKVRVYLFMKWGQNGSLHFTICNNSNTGDNNRCLFRLQGIYSTKQTDTFHVRLFYTNRLSARKSTPVGHKHSPCFPDFLHILENTYLVWWRLETVNRFSCFDSHLSQPGGSSGACLQ